MARNAPTFVCQNCGAAYGRWQGKCEACGEWNTIVEENASAQSPAIGPGRPGRKGRPFALEPLAGETREAPRLPCGIAELDRVTGGGFVRGSALLVGGDPGIGKSTLLIQAAAAVARAGHRAIYISGEEAVAQVRLRAERLGLTTAAVELAAETSVEDIVATLGQGKTPRLVIIDSIQTMWTDTVDSAPGTVTQVRSSAQILIRYAKRSGAAIILVGHVTKDGQIAGPRVVEHMVDAVLSFEGDGAHQFRILPAVFAGVEGTRPLLVEIQALVAPTSLGTPRRAVVGWDQNRLSMVIAVLEAHCGVRLSTHDVYLNVAGGLRIAEPAADLAVAAALVSSLVHVALPADAVYFGEVSLSGVVRPVAQSAARLKEAQKLGFKRAVVPDTARADMGDTELAVTATSSLATLVADIAAETRGPVELEQKPLGSSWPGSSRPSRLGEPPSPPKRDRRDGAPRALARGDPDEPGDDEERGVG